ncbi:MAG: secD, partial [Frankiales bacterium]|nr:secD [Frankiales bacterium]
APAATPAPGAAAGGARVRSGDPYTPASFAALDCSDPDARRGGSTDQPQQQIVACSKDGGLKYHLDVAKVVGTDVKGATAALDQQTGSQWQIVVDFTGKGQDKFTNLTAATIGKNVAIVLDGIVLSAPTIQQRIDSDAQITGDFKQKEANDLANTLKYGALPLSFDNSQVEVVSATLGDDQLHAGLLAGGLGLLAVVVYSILYYRILGLVTVLGLGLSGALLFAAISILGKQIGFALSLAGIAGFIVSVGITADSFVVYFERLKDEIREGRTPRSAADRAWVRARRTILSADTVSFLAAVILYFLSVGSVRGFAFTLGLSTVIDVAVVFLFTRPLVSFLTRFPWFTNPTVSGMAVSRTAVAPATPRVRRPALDTEA